MFSTLGLFQSLPCPRRSDCANPTLCPFSHAPDAALHTQLIATPSDPTPTPTPPRTVPAKRPFELTVSTSRSEPASTASQNRIRTEASRPSRPLPVISASSAFLALPPPHPPDTHRRVRPSSESMPHSRWWPCLSARSAMAAPLARSFLDRPPQAMLKTLYDHFVVLYENLLPSNPTLASEHALRQEEQTHKNSTKLTYRNAVINSIASLKKRPIPTSISHPSVGTDEDIAARAEARNKLDALRLTRSVLSHLLISTDAMQQWGYITEIPDGEGGSKPHAVGDITKCERCGQPYLVSNTPAHDECTYHWGKPFSKTINGEKLRVYSCCSKTTSEDGCSRGFHVFYESDPKDLHLRQPFSLTRSPTSRDGNDSADTAFDVVALDCEMIYTTGGMRVARVSVVDGAGTDIFDELVRMDDGVEVIDYNTRFSGIKKEEHQNASLTLPLIRQSLDAFINSETIIIGHALENDLKTLRMIHYQCIDTVILFPHRAGPPYRRSLRDLSVSSRSRVLSTY
ncbi:ribonuclease H-like protein [Butyriboletus roseoflavus]|nr:ribonuclease H-like protein [Butyriboletus roseoflavus]